VGTYKRIDHPLLLAFCKAVQERREHLGISQEEVAHRAGLHRTYISDVERGARNLSLKNIGRLADALEIPVSALMRSAESCMAAGEARPSAGDNGKRGKRSSKKPGAEP
jgi:transcriptional regulator with XRE-family HTH domain